uniref:Uncharacterized protein n=1 Tax=Myotis myotis TaxID=51298 RepID=A0A7J7Z4L0_MYOMY|nr:hypothetical protein mMyoMyo1_010464 [Myotis myotis]
MRASSHHLHLLMAPSDWDRRWAPAAGMSSGSGTGCGCEQNQHQQRVQVGLASTAGVSAGWDHNVWEQRIFSNHQRLTSMIATSALPCLAPPFTCSTILPRLTPPYSMHAPWWSAHVIVTGCSVVLPFGLFAF